MRFLIQMLIYAVTKWAITCSRIHQLGGEGGWVRKEKRSGCVGWGGRGCRGVSGALPGECKSDVLHLLKKGYSCWVYKFVKNKYQGKKNQTTITNGNSISKKHSNRK